MVRSPPASKVTLPVDARAAAIVVPPLQVTLPSASKASVTASRLTGVIVPTFKFPRDDAINVSLSILPPSRLICAVPTEGCWVC
jgi:hypothetical protein